VCPIGRIVRNVRLQCDRRLGALDSRPRLVPYPVGEKAEHRRRGRPKSDLLVRVATTVFGCGSLPAQIVIEQTVIEMKVTPWN
jgi:hypothetical protein